MTDRGDSFITFTSFINIFYILYYLNDTYLLELIAYRIIVYK